MSNTNDEFEITEEGKKWLEKSSELEKLCSTLAAEQITVNIKRGAKTWRCWLHTSDNRLYSVPSGEGATAVEAVNAACDQRLELLLRDGN